MDAVRPIDQDQAIVSSAYGQKHPMIVVVRQEETMAEGKTSSPIAFVLRHFTYCSLSLSLSSSASDLLFSASLQYS